MQKTIYHYIVFLFVLFLVACSDNEDRNRHESQPSDTLYTEKAALRVHYHNPMRALSIIDSAVIVGNIDENRASLLRAKVYSSSDDYHLQDTATQICLTLLESNYGTSNPNVHEALLDLLATLARNRGDHELTIHWATLKAEHCRQQGDETEALRTEADIALVLSQIGQKEKGLSKLNGIIATLDGQRHFNEMDACIIAIKRKIRILDLLERPDDIIPLSRNIVVKIDDYHQHPDSYADTSYRRPIDDEDIEEYCDFYTAQGHIFMAKAFAQLGMTDSAHRCLALFEQCTYANTFAGRRLMAPVLGLMGQYDKMLNIYDEVEEHLAGDTLTHEYATILKGRAQAAEAAGRYHDACRYWKRQIDINQQVNTRLQESQAHEYAARYQLQEERMKAEHEKQRASKILSFIIAASLIALLAIGICIWLLHQRRIINRKNRILVDQIAEASRYRKIAPHHPIPPTAEKKLTNLNDEELFTYLSEAIRSEQLFLNPNFGRQTLIDRFHLSDRRIGAAFVHGSCHSSLPDFIRELRLEYACQLLAERPDMNITDIATASGFASSTVFGREFKRKFDLTPSFYRTQIADRD